MNLIPDWSAETWLSAAIAAAVIGQLLVAYRMWKLQKATFDLQRTIEDERRQVRLAANARFSLSRMEVELINLSHEGVSISDVSIQVVEGGERRSMGISRTFALRPYHPEAIGGAPLHHFLKSFGSDNRTAAVFFVRFTVSAPHQKPQIRNMQVFEGIFERSDSGETYPVSIGVPTPPRFA